MVRAFGMHMCTLLCLKWISSKDLQNGAGNSSLCLGSLAGRGVWGRVDTRVCLAESLCCSPETITTLLTSYVRVCAKSFQS